MLHMDKSTISRTLARMREAGWIRSEDIGGGVSLSLTSEGATLLTQVFPVWKKAQEEAIEFLGVEGVHAVCQLADIVSKQER